MICEMCGSNNIAKEQGEYVCRNCGCKYSPEEARKLLIEIDKPVEVKGVSTVENDLIRGNQCLDVQEWEAALSIFTSAIAKAATCFQAWYGCLRAMSKDFYAYQPITGDTSRGISLLAVIQNSLKFADDENRKTVISKLEKWENKLQINVKRDQENEQKLTKLQSDNQLWGCIAVVIVIVDLIISASISMKIRSGFPYPMLLGIGILCIIAISLSHFAPKKKDIDQLKQTCRNAIDYSPTLSAINKGMQGYRNP
jgi:hypothetical protein